MRHPDELPAAVMARIRSEEDAPEQRDESAQREAVKMYHELNPYFVKDFTEFGFWHVDDTLDGLPPTISFRKLRDAEHACAAMNRAYRSGYADGRAEA